MKLKKGDQIIYRGTIKTIVGHDEGNYMLSGGTWVEGLELDGVSVLDNNNVIDITNNNVIFRFGDRLYNITRNIKHLDGKALLVPYLEVIEE